MIVLFDETGELLAYNIKPELAEVFKDKPGLTVKEVLTIECFCCKGKGFLELREEKDMKTKDTVKKVMAIWRQFLTDNGGRENLNANILWRWPRYLKKEGREGRC